MKTLLVLSSVLAAGSLWAAQDPLPSDYPFNAENIPPRHNTLLTPKLNQPNEYAGHKVSYGGVAVQIMKTKPAWQIVNPLAPAEYGSGYQNNDEDIITHRSNGIKIFSIHF